MARRKRLASKGAESSVQDLESELSSASDENRDLESKTASKAGGILPYDVNRNLWLLAQSSNRLRDAKAKLSAARKKSNKSKGGPEFDPMEHP